ncbi:type IV-A pilus assembly ATPase PilB [Vibrio renipiscarius]|uniref:General secretion pathway protein GspE n=1 Tax=Vibrio renipiscarius TaxID=1461322 RepID=A0A0C2NQR9_9VIBR|nr:type IV-A pilus assembly ATPase PilB [Vibrio renipiscarius]KII78545.1 general secretion pathway protein GspE [Vibrio renipiscarius]KII82183.1 general secretion pathway protein GspE [Vibrio renipiscarius]
MNQYLLKVLVQEGILSPEQEVDLRNQDCPSSLALLEQVAELPQLNSAKLAEFFSHYFSIPKVDLSQYRYADLCNHLGLSSLIQKFTAIPIKQDAQTLTVAIADPTSSEVEDEFRFATGLQVELVLADLSSTKKAIYSLYGRNLQSDGGAKKEINAFELEQLVSLSDEELSDIEDLSQDEAPVSRYIHQILLEAIRKGASDIHFEPYEKFYRVRLRCDGILVESHQPAAQLGRRLSTRVKILANLDIAERRLPQDGRTKVKLNAELSVDMRVSTLPTLWGEKVVLRLLESSAATLDINRLGYNEEQKNRYLNALKKPQGLILMTGPTGSGKTVSLYTGLSILNTSQVNIATAEDPVEINLPGINQVQVQPHIGFDFATALRSFLRQDPDVVMVGEIRDLETAEIAIKASQTGHLVLSTLHTNSAAETLIRLQNMGIQPYNLASSLSLIIAQRLIRKLCRHCKLPCDLDLSTLSPALLAHFSLGDTTPVFQANSSGCEHCNHGYHGRLGLFEVMEVSGDLHHAILKQAGAKETEEIARRQGMMTLQESGMEKLLSGETSLQELQRVLFLT